MSVVLENDQEYARAFGEVIRTMRKVRKLSQEALAAKAGLAYASVRAWETGRPRPNGKVQYVLPNLHNLRTLCKALDLPVWKLLRAVDWKISAAEVWKVREKEAEVADEAASAATPAFDGCSPSVGRPQRIRSQPRS